MENLLYVLGVSTQHAKESAVQTMCCTPLCKLLNPGSLTLEHELCSRDEQLASLRPEHAPARGPQITGGVCLPEVLLRATQSRGSG